MSETGFPSPASSSRKSEPIAIVGIGCRFPGGVSDPESYWDFLISGGDGLIDIPDDRWKAEKFYDPDLNPGTCRVRRGGFLTCHVEDFDAEFFGISPREADHIDPQQRLLLEVTWEALENSGTPLERLAGSATGVFIGGFTLDYGQLQLAGTDRSQVGPHTATGVVMTMLANRISHAFNFTGPSMAIDTACSSALVAVHIACHSLWSGESSTAIAGGVNLMLTPNFTIAASQGGFLSPTSTSHPFDASANGYVRGEGSGIVVLKRLADAIRDGDRIYALIRGTAVTQDGHTNGITVPDGDSQQRAMRAALAEAGVAASSVEYVEAHGTGTAVGDPIEASAIGEVYGRGSGRPPGERCVISSVKANIGHLEAAAGVASLIKAVLCLTHRQVPPQIHLTVPNPQIDLAALRLEIPLAARTLTGPGGVIQAAVNSFGFGGTNAHVVLESSPQVSGDTASGPAGGDSAGCPGRLAHPLPNVFPVSARSQGALAELAGRYAQALRDTGCAANLASAVAHRRTHHRQARLAVVADSTEDLRAALDSAQAGQPHPAVHVSSAGPSSSPLAFVYTGMGPQWWGMGRQLLTTNRVFRDVIDRCDAAFRSLGGWSLTEEMLAPETASRMGQTAISQPANFALQVALTQVWASLGIRPTAIIGHSAGEIAAAYLAGSLTFDDAATVIFHRARIQHKTAGQGRLLAVAIPEERAAGLPGVKDGRLSIASVNSPTSSALVGAVPDLEEVAALLEAEDVFCRFVAGNVPFHGRAMDPLRAEAFECLSGIAPLPPAMPLYSTVSGRKVLGAVHDAAYWWGNIRQPVRFADAALALIDDGITAFVEVGPHPALTRALAECLGSRGLPGVTVPSLNRKQPDSAALAHSCAELYVAGFSPDWGAFYPEDRHEQLPAYPWQRERYWKEAGASRQDRLGETEHPLLGARRDSPMPTWRRRLDGSRPAYLADHRVMDAILLPGAGYVEMALAGGRALFGASRCIVENVRFEAPVIMHDGPAYLLDTTVDGTTGQAAIYGCQSDGRHWVRHASMRLGPPAVSAPEVDLPAVRERCGEQWDGDRFYEAVRERGFEYGPSFRPIDRLWIGDREALGRFTPDALAATAGDDLVLDPVALDGCFQMLLPFAVPPSEAHAALLPVGVDKIIVHGRPSGPLWVYARPITTAGNEIAGDAVLVAGDGRAVAEVRGFRARLVGERQQPRKRLGTRWLYEVHWEQDPGAQDADGQPGDVAAGQWLVLADRGGIASAVAGQLRSLGHRVAVVRPARQFAAIGDDEFLVRPGEGADLQRVLRAVAERADLPVRGIVHLSSADLGVAELTRDSLWAAVGASTASVLDLVQALDAEELNWPLTIVTVGAQPIDGRLGPAGLLQGPLWGMGRVLHQESLALQTRLVDLDPDRPLGDVAALVTELVRPDAEEDQLAWRAGNRLVARLQPSRRESGSVPYLVRPDASYLITGGFGALGLIFARWLAMRGALRIVLLGRTALPPRSTWRSLPPDDPRIPAIEAIKGIEKLGAVVEAVSLDVTDSAALGAFVRERRDHHMPPFRGIIHAAGSVQDQIMVRMTKDQLDQVLRPKVLGAWSLHEALADEPLEFFALFSSVSSLVVTTGQGNYAAGNAFLDGLAHYRRSSGLPALSVNWGPWDTGMIAQLKLQSFYQERGMDLIPEQTGVQFFEELLGSDEVQQLVASAHWPTVIAHYAVVPRLVLHLGHEDKHAAGDALTGAVPIAERLAAAPPEEHRQLIADGCAEVVGSVLHLRRDKIAPTIPLSQLGLDSMIAVELKIRLEQAFGVAPKLVLLLQGATVDRIADDICSRRLA
jgi:hybrid polyketide synthase/nonribosomal peptide synthetase FtdB